MGDTFKETAHLNTDMEKYKANYDRIFRKDKKEVAKKEPREFTYNELINEIPKLVAINAANDVIINNLKRQLEDANGVIDFYAHPETDYTGGCETSEYYCEIGGFKAREYKAKYEI